MIVKIDWWIEMKEKLVFSSYMQIFVIFVFPDLLWEAATTNAENLYKSIYIE